MDLRGQNARALHPEHAPIHDLWEDWETRRRRSHFALPEHERT